MKKRIIAGLLVLALLFSAVPVNALAAQPEEQAAVNTGDVSIEGTNGFGTLLSQEITESQAETAEESEDYEAGYTVTDLVIEGTTATVTYDSMEEALLVVALYTEDGMRMVTSATATVTADATEATVEFTEEMPEYFLASAYLMDTYDLSPLCAAYDTPMYTQEMQELLASTVEDYDADRVLNLDDDNTTNFAIYAETTKVIEAVEGANIVESIDEENATYIIKNADEQITSLTAGDVFVYPYAVNEILIVKVGTIAVDGTAVTITGGELEMEEAFSQVKIQGQASQEDAQLDRSYAGEGVKYLGKGASVVNACHPLDQGVSDEVVVNFELDIKEDFNLTGKLTVKAKLGLEIYVTKSHQRVKLAVDYSLEVGAKVEVSDSEPITRPKDPKEVPLILMTFPVLPGVEVMFIPSLVFAANVTAELTLTFAGTFGVAFNHTKEGWDVDNLCTAPDPVVDLKVEGTIFVGLQLTPALTALGGCLANAEVEGRVGLEIKCAVSVSTEQIENVRHNCVGCWDGEIGFVRRITPSIQFLKSDKLKMETTLINSTAKLCDFYISLSNLEMGFGDCPNISYKLTVYAVNEEKKPVANALVSVNGKSHTTNANGVAELYLPAKLHTIEVSAGELSCSEQIYMDQARKLTATLTAEGGCSDSGSGFGGVLGEIDEEEITDDSYLDETGMYLESMMIVNSDQSAADQGGSFIDVLGIHHGTADLHGNEMEHGLEAWIARDDFQQELSWAWAEYSLDGAYTNLLGKVTVLADGENTTDFDSTFEIIGDGEMLFSARLYPDMAVLSVDVDVTGINTLRIYVYDNQPAKGGTAFALWDFRVIDAAQSALIETGSCGENITWTLHSDGILKISGSGTMPAYLPGFLQSPWEPYRDWIQELVIADGVENVGEYAFFEYPNLKKVTIPDSVADIGWWAFKGCSSLEAVDFGDHVTRIGDYAFADCSSLLRADLPASVRGIGMGVFQNCGSLTCISVDENNAVYAGDSTGALLNKEKSKLICVPAGLAGHYEIQEGVTTIGDEAFEGCSSLVSIAFPDSVVSIGSRAFWDCTGLTRITVDENNPSYAGDAAGLLLSKDQTTLVYVPLGLATGHYTIPSGITVIGSDAFSYCSALTDVTIPDSVTTIDDCAFEFCRNLTSVTIPGSVVSIGNYAFSWCSGMVCAVIGGGVTEIRESAFIGCTSLAEVTMGEQVSTIGDSAFQQCSRLTSITIPASVGAIGFRAFSGCEGLQRIRFMGSAPSFVSQWGSDVFENVTATAYYPEDDLTWTTDVMQDYGGTITWVPYAADEDVCLTTGPVKFVSKKSDTGIHAVYPGDYDSEVTGICTLKTASFTGLVPSEQYVLLAMKSIEVDDPLAADNLLFIDQAEALEDGTLSFQYVQRETVDISYVVACGASNKDLNDAEITFPEKLADGELQVVDPTVVYDGVTLTEGRDYVIVGTVAFTEGGEYTCYIRGIHNYTGLVKCTYTVTATAVASGWSGYTTWTLTDDGTLTFSGEGAMKNYTTKDGMPWYDYADQITKVIIEEGVTSIGDYAFYGMPNLESITIPETVTSTGSYAFKNAAKLDGVVLPDGLTKLGESAFYGCASLTFIDIPTSLWTIQPYTFKNCTSLAEVTFHEGNLQKISDGAFYNTALTAVELPDCLTILDVYVFKNCSDLASVKLSAGLTQIREASLYGTAISIIEIPEGVTSIKPYAFKNCVNLTAVSLPSTLTAVEEAAFYACTKLVSVDLPDAVTKIGNYAFRKCTVLTSVNFGSGLTDIGESSFYGCTGLTELVIPEKVTAIGAYAFKGCTAVISVSLPDRLVTIGDSAFHTCTGLKTIVIPANVETIGEYCFSGNWNLRQIIFEGDAPTIGTSAFKSVVATAYYPSDNSTWTSDLMQNYGGSITWTAQ